MTCIKTTKGRPFLFGSTLLGALSGAASALAGPATPSATIPATATSWSIPADVGQFDPSTGTLQSIGLGLTGTLRGTIGVESLDAMPGTVGAGIASTISLFSPGGGPAILSVAPAVGASADLAAYDGKTDFSGASGRTFSGLSATQSAQTTYIVGAPGLQIPTAPFIGKGTVALPMTASANASLAGPLNLAARTQAAAGANVSVQYGAASSQPIAGVGAGIDFGSTLGLVNLPPFGVQHTAVQTRTLSDQVGNWTRGVAFDRFNPSLGTLIGADIALSGDATTRLSVQNTGAGGGAYKVDRTVTFDLLRPDRTSLGSVAAQSTRSGMLDPFSGADDFTAPFGTTTSDTLLSPTAAISAATGTDLSLFSGLGVLSLELDAVGTLLADLPGSADLLSTAMEGAIVSLSYSYLPGAASAGAVAAAVPEPSSLALLALWLASFRVLHGQARLAAARALVRRRRR